MKSATEIIPAPSSPATVSTSAAAVRWKSWLGAASDQLGLLIVLAILIGAFAATTRHFFSAAEFLTIANQVPATVVTAVGMTYVLVIAGIDLSVGSVLALGGAVVGVLMTRQPAAMGLVPAVIVGLLAGLACGLVNGLVTVIWSIPSFIVTLGMLEIARGATHLITDSRTQYIGSPIAPIADWLIGGLSLPFLLAILIVIIGQLVLSRTVFGRYMVAIGTNEEAVRLSGIDPRPVKIAVFAIAGLLAGFGGVIDTSRAQAASPNAAIGLELDVIAAVVIGGTSLMGGRGSVINSFLGVIIIAVLGAGLAARGVRDETKRLVTGCVIVLAVILDYYRHRFATRRN
ncbi:MAG TPA: ABC transporter permease [Tepidisphaeraceae bacterium]|nr:ABC transporter permease [Tepidisphaeraceae bacterium]